MKKRFHEHPLIGGALLLTVAGVLSRLIGFFYKIFLSRTIGAEGMGIYQLIFPVIGICFSLTSAGIQTSISRYVSKAIGVHNHKEAKSYLQIGLFFSCALSLLLGSVLFTYADFIAIHLLKEARCASLLEILSFSLLPACIHCCLNGYYYGKKQAAIPAVSQIVEQVVRVGSVYLIDQILDAHGKDMTISLAVLGLVFGEIAGMLFTISFMKLRLELQFRFSHAKELLSMAVPLTATRLIINLFSSVEHILIPGQLVLYGYTSKEALSIFGILTGMSLSVIMFPSVVTNSVSVLLLPTISEAQAKGNHAIINKAIRQTISACLLLGFGACFAFLVTGSFIGNVIFENTLSGTFIKTLSWICPFLYLSNTLNSILHGLGYPKFTFYLGVMACVVRILFVYFGVPVWGISAYLYGMIVSDVLHSVVAIWMLHKITQKPR